MKNKNNILSIPTFLFAFAFLILSCDKKEAEIKELKMAFVDTSLLMNDSEERKDIEEKFKTYGAEKSKQLQVEIEKFKREAISFQAEAQAKGQAWAQQKGAELQQREQKLAQAQQELSQQLQQEGSQQLDSLVTKAKRAIKVYGKEKGYNYIFGTGDTNPSVLYGEPKNDITKEMIKLLNEKYKSTSKKE